MADLLPDRHLSTGARERVGLPDRLLAEGVQRAGLAGLFYSAIYFLASGAAAAVVLSVRGPNPGWWIQVFGGLFFVVCGLGFWGLTRSTRLDVTQVLDLALVFEVVAALGISLPAFVGSFTQGWHPEEDAHFGITWVGVWIIGFAVTVPATPAKAALAALASSAMTPLGMLIGSSLAGTRVPAFVWFLWTFPDVIAAGLAAWLSLSVFRLGREIRLAEQLGSYNLVERLGAGGMGEVWRAEHALLARPAAIKVIRPEHLGSASPEAQRKMLKRFEREAKATARLGSVHTVQLFDFGVTGDGAFYYVMELLDGLDLDSLVRRFGPVSAERAAFLVHQACESLAEAHAIGLIHRDIKPANLFTCRAGLEVDFVKVLDFGLVKTLEDEGDRTRLTAEGIAAGSPAFMAPEIAASGQVDGRTDIYALGCVLYWLLTGHLVFDAPSSLQLAVAHVRDEPVPPSQRGEVAIPPDLEALVLQCLAKDPATRPQSAAALAEALSATADPLAWTEERRQRWWERHLPAEALSSSGPGVSGSGLRS